MTNTIEKRQNVNQPATFGNVFDNIFQNSLHRFFDDNFWGPEKRPALGSVPVNVKETNQAYEIEVVAPGCQKEAFKINVNGNLLTISFEHDEEDRQQDDKTGWLRNEYSRRSFKRSFTLDDSIDLNGINAKYKDGVLLLQLPKIEKAKQESKRIEIE
jgi:HSP20 family protein